MVNPLKASNQIILFTERVKVDNNQNNLTFPKIAFTQSQKAANVVGVNSWQEASNPLEIADFVKDFIDKNKDIYANDLMKLKKTMRMYRKYCDIQTKFNFLERIKSLFGYGKRAGLNKSLRMEQEIGRQIITTIQREYDINVLIDSLPTFAQQENPPFPQILSSGARIKSVKRWEKASNPLEISQFVQKTLKSVKPFQLSSLGKSLRLYLETCESKTRFNLLERLKSLFRYGKRAGLSSLYDVEKSINRMLNLDSIRNSDYYVPGETLTEVKANLEKILAKNSSSQQTLSCIWIDEKSCIHHLNFKVDYKRFSNKSLEFQCVIISELKDISYKPLTKEEWNKSLQSLGDLIHMSPQQRRYNYILNHPCFTYTNVNTYPYYNGVTREIAKNEQKFKIENSDQIFFIQKVEGEEYSFTLNTQYSVGMKININEEGEITCSNYTPIYEPLLNSLKQPIN